MQQAASSGNNGPIFGPVKGSSPPNSAAVSSATSPAVSRSATNAGPVLGPAVNSSTRNSSSSSSSPGPLVGPEAILGSSSKKPSKPATDSGKALALFPLGHCIYLLFFDLHDAGLYDSNPLRLQLPEHTQDIDHTVGRTGFIPYHYHNTRATEKPEYRQQKRQPNKKLDATKDIKYVVTSSCKNSFINASSLKTVSDFRKKERCIFFGRGCPRS
jgi:hypothetical protein